MRAKITAAQGYRCAPRGAIVEEFAFGQIVDGSVAAWAVGDGAAEALQDPRDTLAISKPVETKKQRGRPRKKAE